MRADVLGDSRNGTNNFSKVVCTPSSHRPSSDYLRGLAFRRPWRCLGCDSEHVPFWPNDLLWAQAFMLFHTIPAGTCSGPFFCWIGSGTGNGVVSKKGSAFTSPSWWWWSKFAFNGIAGLERGQRRKGVRVEGQEENELLQRFPVVVVGIDEVLDVDEFLLVICRSDWVFGLTSSLHLE